MFRFFVFLFFCVALCRGQCSNRTDSSCVDDCRWSDVLTCCLPVTKTIDSVSPTVTPTVNEGSPSSSPSKQPTNAPTEYVTLNPEEDSSVETEINGGEISAIVIGLVVALFLLTFGICSYMKKQKSSSDPEP